MWSNWSRLAGGSLKETSEPGERKGCPRRRDEATICVIIQSALLGERPLLRACGTGIVSSAQGVGARMEIFDPQGS